jgi:hypothetical protein
LIVDFVVSVVIVESNSESNAESNSESDRKISGVGDSAKLGIVRGWGLEGSPCDRAIKRVNTVLIRLPSPNIICAAKNSGLKYQLLAIRKPVLECELPVRVVLPVRLILPKNN